MTSDTILEGYRGTDLRKTLTVRARYNLAVLFAAAITIVLAYAGLVALQIGVLRPADQWVSDIIELRRVLYDRELRGMPATEPKTFLVGGSGTLFSASGGLIQKLTGQRTFNMGLYAGLDVDLLFVPAMRWIGKGDRVLAPIELPIYARAEPSEYSANSLLGLFYPYLHEIPLHRLLPLLFALRPLDALQAAFDRLDAELHPTAVQAPSDDQRIANWHEARVGKDPAGLNAYDYSTLNDHGDKVLLMNPSEAQIDALSSTAQPFSPRFSIPGWRAVPWEIDGISTWRQRLSERGAKLYLTWMVLSEDDSGLIYDEAMWADLIAFARDMAEHGQPFYCDPIGAILPMQYRYDTLAHFNIKGQDLYSRSLAACLADIDHQAFDYEHADPKVLAARARARIEALKAPPDPLYFAYERNIRELQGLERELDDIHTRSGTYPEALPALAEPASSFPAARIWYRSIGTDYKLLIEDPDECRIVRLGWPGMIDPKRTGPDGCGAYGYWTAGAADW